jgi:hypothetical protein
MISYGANLGLMVNAATGEVHDVALRGFLRGVDGLVQPNVKGYLTNTPPGSPSDGDAYIIGAAPTGAWAGNAGKVARWSANDGAWEFYAPKNGWTVQSNSAREVYRYTGGAWEIFHQEGTFTPFIYGITTAGEHTYSDQVGIYTRIGNRADILVRCTISTFDTTMAGSVRVGGLPYSSRSTVAVNIYANSLAAGVNYIGGTIATSNNYVGLFKNAPGGATASLQSTDVQAGSAIRVTSVMFIHGA